MGELAFEALLFVGELILEILASGGVELLVESRGKRDRAGRSRQHRPTLTLIGLLLLGVLVGIAGTLVVPRRILPPPAVPGLSLVLSPLAAGVAMHGLGRWRRASGHHPSRLATFWGGAVFALGMAVSRFVLLG